MQAYGKVFAKVYNTLWGGFAQYISPLLYDFYEASASGETKERMLDLCCGTGQLALFFLEKGYRVVGLDLSEHMLVYARENAEEYVAGGQAEFVHGDAAEFTLDEYFGLVVSTYDALNHLEGEESLQGCFCSVYQVLDEGGYFIFDLNTRKGLERWNGVQVNPSEEVFLLTRGIFEPGNEKAWTKITGFVRNDEGFYQRFEETVFNTVFDMLQVKELLIDSGFKDAYFARADALDSPIDEPEEEGRVFFVAIK
jgi:SAM-dependent methyltransferase